MTNRQWLLEQMQNMSDEELAGVMNSGDYVCLVMDKPQNECIEPCNKCIEVWLKSEHKEQIKISDAERVILENMDGNYQYICRDKNGQLMVYLKKPRKDNTIWNDELDYDYKRLTLFEHLFQFIKWEDTEPYNIEELLKGE